MDSVFWTYLKLGRDHIADLGAYDHMLFLLALCAVFTISHWRQVILLATGFTLGHSITLIGAGLDIIRFPMDVIEILIPVTIILTGIYNLRRGPLEKGESLRRNHYFLAAGFGLIHGMGFSNFLRSALMPGEESELVIQLLAFNIGIELGQVIIVLVILAISWLIVNQFGLSKRYWNGALSILAIGVSLFLLWEKIPF
ncbi:MAG: HupE/UreJ family protein [Saprospiraceae bacterium]|nr:HupE/UreJ family protein [Saprospiraceae bacterium]